jgi:OOP family OmpA-OmpF porin
MRSKIFYSQLFGLLLLLLLVLLVVPKYMNVIPTVLKQRVDKKFTDNGLKWVAVRVKNRDVTLSGIAPTLDEHTKAVRLAKEQRGIRLVVDKISPRLMIPYSLNLSYDGEMLKLQGYMPSKVQKSELLQKVKVLYGNTYIDEVDIASGEPIEWNAFVFTLLQEMKKFELSSVNIVDQELHISGKIRTNEKKEEVEKSLNTFTKDGFVIHSHVVSMDAAARVCQEKFNLLLGKKKIEFASNKSLIKATNNRLLEELSNIALLCPNVKIEIVGHTDSKGNDAENLALSLSRAKAVVAKLFSLGIPLERLNAKGLGESKPLYTNETKEGRAKNRRIEFKVENKKGRS